MKQYSLHKHCHVLLFGFLISISCNVQNQPHLPEDNANGPAGEPKTGADKGNPAAYGPRDIVQCALLDRSGNLWFGTTGGEGLFRYDPSAQVGTGDHSFTNYTEKDGLCSNEISCIYEDKAGILWFGTDDGVSRFDPSALSKTGEKPFTCMLIADEALNSFSGIVQGQQKTRSARPFRELDSFTDSVQGPVVASAIAVSSILQDKNGDFWFGTLDHGVYRYDPSAQPGEKAFTNFLSHEVVRCITEDQNGNIWVGSWSNGGVHRYDGSQANHPCIKNSCKHDLRIPQDLKTHNQEIAKSTPNFIKQDGLPDGMISCIFEDKNGHLWFGTRDYGLCRYDPSVQQAGGSFFTYFSEDKGLCNNNISSILEDKTGVLWIGSTVKFGTTPGGICRYDPSAQVGTVGPIFTHFKTKEGLENNDIFCSVQDKAGNLWFGGRYGRLFRYNGAYKKGKKQADNSFTDFSTHVHR